MKNTIDYDVLQNTTSISQLDELVKSLGSAEIHEVIGKSRIGELAAHISKIGGNGTPLDRMRAAAAAARLLEVLGSPGELLAETASALLQRSPPALSELRDGDEKYYFAIALGSLRANRLLKYSTEAAVSEENAENARKKLLEISLRESGQLATWIYSVRSALLETALPVGEQRLKRMRRVAVAMEDVCARWDGTVGEIGPALEALSRSIFERCRFQELNELSIALFDHLIEVLRRAIQTHISTALLSKTYALLPALKGVCSDLAWTGYTTESPAVQKCRTLLLEAMVILARQGKTDRDVVRLLEVTLPVRSLLEQRVVTSFGDARDVAPEVQQWWKKLGRVAAARSNEQDVEPSVDQAIGMLAIRLEDMVDAAGKLSTDVAPLLHVTDPVLAPVVASIARDHAESLRLARQLCRMRKIEAMGLTGMKMEFNPGVHEFLPGTTDGHRIVRVLRDGVLKDYGGQKKAILKALVEPAP